MRLGDTVVVKLETEREAGETATEAAEGVDRREEERRALRGAEYCLWV